MSADTKLLNEQLAYYRARAPEYDEWFNRTGRYNRGAVQRAQWFDEIATVDGALRSMAPLGEVLEFACGTGLWTERLAAIASHVRAVDASPEAIAISRARVAAPTVEYIVADIFEYEPGPPVDMVCFAFWLSHVPSTRFESFWQLVRRSLRLGGRAFFVDSLHEESSTAIDHEPPDHSGIARRKLNDGREFSIVKMFYDPHDLRVRLASLGWRGDVRSTGTYFLYGTVEPMA